MARLLQRVGLRRPGVVLAALVIGGGALMAATGATAGPGVSTTTPFTFSGANVCVTPPENFLGSGQLHLLISDNASNSGNIQFHIEATFSGMQAVTIAGKKYVVISQEEKTLTFDTDGAPAHETVESTLQFVRSGEDGTPIVGGDDFFEHFLAHITANANGTVTVQDVETDTRCR